MENGLPRYYHTHDMTRKDSRGYSGVYPVIDRNTNGEVAVCDNWNQAEDKVKDLIKKDKIARGIKVIDLLEIPFTHRDRSRAITEVQAVTIHK
jgi:hypothetical protein